MVRILNASGFFTDLTEALKLEFPDFSKIPIRMYLELGYPKGILIRTEIEKGPRMIRHLKVVNIEEVKCINVLYGEYIKLIIKDIRQNFDKYY